MKTFVCDYLCGILRRGFHSCAFAALGLGLVAMTAACGPTEPADAGPLGSTEDPPGPLAESPLAIKGTFPPDKRIELGSSPPVPRAPLECSESFKPTPCKRYYLPLLGNPSMSDNIELRKKYKAEFGLACYVAADANSTFNCFYEKKDLLGPKKDWKGKACTDAAKIGQVSGLAMYDQGYPCKEDPNTDDYWVQVGSDSANRLYIKLGDAPLQHPLILVDGVPTLEINGPYRNLPEPSKVLPGKDFHCYRIDGVVQKERILQMNRKKHGQLRSDLAGYEYECDGPSAPKCKEPEFLNEPSKPYVYDEDAAQVDHVASMADPRGCKWGTNSNKNAAVISTKLNNYFSNNERPKEVFDMINAIPAYTP